MHLPNNPRPWLVELDDVSGQVKDADGTSIATFDPMDDAEFWRGIVEIVNEHARLHEPAAMSI